MSGKYKVKPKQFVPKNPEKYVGDPSNIICRSGIELRYMKFFDENPNILRYASEEFHIPYLSPVDKKMHRYFPDFIVEVKTKTGEKKTFVIEVKSFSETQPPRKGKNTKRLLEETQTWAVNNSKWEHARNFCKKRGFHFMVLTEKEIKFKWS